MWLFINFEKSSLYRQRILYITFRSSENRVLIPDVDAWFLKLQTEVTEAVNNT